jgi:integrase
MAALKIKGVTLHSLRHTHASQLIASGMDVLTISCRLGHASPCYHLDSVYLPDRRQRPQEAEVMEHNFALLQTE